jgi:hypothetical protein
VDQGSVSCLDPGPYFSNWDVQMREEGKDSPLPTGVSPLPFLPSIVSRSLEGIEAAQGMATSLHSGHAAAESGHQQNEHIVFKTVISM